MKRIRAHKVRECPPGRRPRARAAAPVRALRALSIALLALTLVASPAGEALADQIDKLTLTLKKSRSEKARIAAALRLGKSRNKRAVRPLIRGLRDRSNTVRAVSASSLGILADPAALPALKRATRDKDKSVRREAVAAIGRIRSGKKGKRFDNSKRAHYSIAGREAPLLKKGGPQMFVVVKSASDKSTGKLKAKQRKVRAKRMKRLMIGALRKNRRVTLSETHAESLGLQPYSVDLTLVDFKRLRRGAYIEIECEIRVAISNQRGKMLSFLTGGAKIQVPRTTFRRQYEPQLREEALEGAVKKMHRDLVSFLQTKPT